MNIYLVRKFYKKKRISPKNEIKGNTLTNSDQVYIAKRTFLRKQGFDENEDYSMEYRTS